ncbi:MAG: hypothetical protein H6576_05170 [Lewinellaceae bacterium]|nr:hypothetical protein [Saprospiraceae bacterium]MCB9343061.1 hypothetical protein [Lewinellaceae bacterium]
MLRATLFCLTLTLLSLDGFAQGSLDPQQNVGIIYSHERTFNLRLATSRSMAVGMEFGKLRTYDKTKTWNISLGELKHPKEQRQSADPRASRAFRPFVYAKQNSLFVVRAGWGAKKYFSEKAKQKGVAIGMSYSIGPSLGLLKPYYLALAIESDGGTSYRVRHQKYSSENAKIFLDNTRILGASPFTRGIGESSFLPGGNASIAYHMDWGAFDEMVKALEIGLMVDVFAKKAPIFVSDTQNKQVFFNFFLNLQFGKRR